MDNPSRPFGSGPGGSGPGGSTRPAAPSSAGRTAQPPASGGPSQTRSLYQQRMDQIKVRIVELSHRNMEGAMRVLRLWLADKDDARK